MKCGIVMSSTLTKYNHWCARFYLGATDEAKEAVRKAELRLAAAERSLAAARTELAGIEASGIARVMNKEVVEFNR